jgi:hypothetical protein
LMLMSLFLFLSIYQMLATTASHRLDGMLACGLGSLALKCEVI